MATKDRIFLAHASEDKPQVRRLYQQLEDRGLSPWLDAVDLIPGQNWREEIPKAIRDAAVCLACLSKQSVAKKSYVQREFRYALSAYADLPPGSIYMIPVRLDNCDVLDLRLPELELNLRDLQWVDLFEPDGFDRLVASIKHTLSLESEQPSEKMFRDMDELWCPGMMVIRAGSFLMGSPKGEAERRDNEGPQHSVTLGRDFGLGRHPVTFHEYDHFCEMTGKNKPDDQGWGRDERPVICVSSEDAEAYLIWLSQVTGADYRLPTEAEWEYACRATTTTPFSTGLTIGTGQANFDGNFSYQERKKGIYRGQTTKVGQFAPNAFGLSDMHGNVWEWCADGPREYTRDSVINPNKRLTNSVARGGSWRNAARSLRSACRFPNDPGFFSSYVGFRCARLLS